MCGESINYTGPNGLQAANYLSESLINMGIELRRFKTGTPSRMAKRRIDFCKMVAQFGAETCVPFSFYSNLINGRTNSLHFQITSQKDY